MATPRKRKSGTKAYRRAQSNYQRGTKTKAGKAAHQRASSMARKAAAGKVSYRKASRVSTRATRRTLRAGIRANAKSRGATLTKAQVGRKARRQHRDFAGKADTA